VVHVCALARLLMDVSAAAEVFRTLLYTSHVRRARQQLRYARTAAGGKRRASALHLAARHARVTMRIARRRTGRFRRVGSDRQHHLYVSEYALPHGLRRTRDGGVRVSAFRFPRQPHAAECDDATVLTTPSPLTPRPLA
jgi:hypothetical protein